MTTTPTALMPIDPAVSPARVSRLLPIRANLLPEEIRAGRHARRTKIVLIVAVIVVLAALTGWYVYAVKHVKAANANLATASKHVRETADRKDDFSGVQQIIDDRNAVTADLKTLMAADLPWAATMDGVRVDANATDVVITAIAGTLLEDDGTARTAGSPVATLSITGSAPDKKHVAAFLDKLADHDGVTDPYLTTASGGGGVTYAFTAKLTPAALCGRFTKPCPRTGGN